MVISAISQKGGAGKSTVIAALASEAHRQGRKVLLVDTDDQGSLHDWQTLAKGAPKLVVHGGGPFVFPKGYDVIFIDCSAKIEGSQGYAMLASDLVLLPCAPRQVEAWTLEKSIAVLHEVQAMRPKLKGAIVVNRAVARARDTKLAVDMLSENGVHVFETMLKFRVGYYYDLGGGGAFDKDPIGFEVRRLWKEVEAYARA